MERLYIEFINKFKKFKNIKWKLPYLEIYINIPFLTIKTQILSETVEMYAKMWIRLEVKLFKWNWNFKLYSPEGRR